MAPPLAGGRGKKRPSEAALGPFSCPNPHCSRLAYKTEAGLAQHLRRDDSCRLYYKQAITDPWSHFVTKQAAALEHVYPCETIGPVDTKPPAIHNVDGDGLMETVYPNADEAASVTSDVTTVFFEDTMLRYIYSYHYIE